MLKWNEKSLFHTKSPDWWPLLHVLFILNFRTTYIQAELTRHKIPTGAELPTIQTSVSLE